MEELNKLLKLIRDGTDISANLGLVKKHAMVNPSKEKGKIARECFQEGVIHLTNEHKYLLLEWGTGTGKSKPAIDFITQESRGMILVVVKQNSHIENWHKEFAKWGCDTIGVEFINYRSLKKLRNTYYEFIIFDECHAITEANAKHIQTIKFDYSMGLSATIYPEKRKILKRFGFKRSHLPLKDVISMRILPPLKVVLVPKSLDAGTPQYTFKMHRKTNKNGLKVFPYRSMKKAKNWYNKGYNVDVKCTPIEYYWLFNDRISTAMYLYKTALGEANEMEEQGNIKKAQSLRKSAKFHMVTAKRLGSEKKNFLAWEKVPLMKKIIEKEGKNKRFITFCNLVEQCRKVADGNAMVHSEDKELSKNIQRFNDGEINQLHTVRQADESINLKKLDKGFILALDKKMLSGIQRAGRVIRSDEPYLYIMYVRNTTDEDIVMQYCKEMQFQYEIYDSWKS